MVTILQEGERLNVPGWVTDLDAFRRWTDSDGFPEHSRIWWLQGEVWIDLTREQIFSHVLVKTEISAVLDALADREQTGMYLTVGALLSNVEADISGNPDGLFLSNETLASDRVRLIEGKDGGFVELQGSPDMVLEILSKSSEEKDNVILKEAYHRAGIREYWLVDARQDPLVFDIFRHRARGYVRTSKQHGWVKSAVFGRSFRFTVREGAQGHPDYSLEFE